MKRRKGWITFGALVIGAVVATVLFLRNRGDSEPIDPAMVIVAERAPLAINVLEVGRIEAFEEVKLTSRRAGRVVAVQVSEGDKVEIGTPLVLLDPVAAKREVSKARVQLTRAKADLKFQQQTLARQERGFRMGVVPGVKADEARQQTELARLQVRAARVDLSVARDHRRDMQLVAPIAGTVIRRNIEPGETVRPGVEVSPELESLMTIADLSRLRVTVELNQVDVAKAQLGQRVSLVLDALPGETFHAKLSRIAAASTRKPGKDFDVFPVEALLTMPDPRIKPGMTADVRIHVSEKPGVVSLPLESVRREEGKAFVKRIVAGDSGETTEQVQVTLGVENDRRVEVVSGIDAGERVLIDPPSAADNETKI